MFVWEFELSLLFNRLFDENLKEVDKGIEKTVAQFNELFPDGRTAFIFTSDHGMSNKGSVYVFQFDQIKYKFIYYNVLLLKVHMELALNMRLKRPSLHGVQA